MRVPKSLEALLHDGIIEEVVRPLMSGKEAQVYLVVADGQQCAAKIYKDAQSRSFKNRADYTEGRQVRNSRDQRAISRGTKYGKSQDESAWKSTEVEMIYRLRAAGVRVPAPHTFIDGVLVMELVTDRNGQPAPRLGDLNFSPPEATAIYRQLLSEVVRLLCAGVVHGDLSEFNVLLGVDGPVLIDFPQSVNAAQNLNSRALLVRDVNNLHRFLSRWVPGAPRRLYAEEMWALYESNHLTPETQLTGNFRQAGGPVDTRAVLGLIGDANRDEASRRRARGESTGGLELEQPAPAGRRREVVVDRPQARGGPGRGPARADGATHSAGQRRADAPRPAFSGRDNNRRPDPSHPAQAARRPTTTPKRGDNVQASTYVSPEARKIKVKALTPRDGAGSPGPRPQHPPEQPRGQRPPEQARGPHPGPLPRSPRPTDQQRPEASGSRGPAREDRRSRGAHRPGELGNRAGAPSPVATTRPAHSSPDRPSGDANTRDGSPDAVRPARRRRRRRRPGSGPGGQPAD